MAPGLLPTTCVVTSALVMPTERSMMSSNCSVEPPTETMPTVLPFSSSAELIGLSFAEMTWNVEP